MLSMLEPFKSILEEMQTHTQFRATCYWLLLGSFETEFLEPYKCKHEFERNEIVQAVH